MFPSHSDVIVTRVQIEHLRETLGIGIDRPRLSWQIETNLQNWQQAGYEIQCYRADGNLRAQTGRVESIQSVLLDWSFEPLQSREQVSLRVRVWGSDGSESAWSESVALEAGLLHPEDWSAGFISPAWDEDITKSNPAPYLRREFELRSGVQYARLYISALGVY
jgi:alpha-L-rhamnosidase